MAKAFRIGPEDVEFTAIRAQGTGGQNVNKVSNAAHLRFDVGASRLPAGVRERLLALAGQRATKEGVIVIKSQEFRSLEQNRAEALRRLQELVDEAARPRAVRRPTRPTRSSVQERLESKARLSRTKAARRRPAGE